MTDCFLPSHMNGGDSRIGGKRFQEFLPAHFGPGAADLYLEGDLIAAVLLTVGKHLPDASPVLLGMGADAVQSCGNVICGEGEVVQITPGAYQLVLEHFKNGESDENEHHTHDGNGVVTASRGNAQAGNCPEAGGGGQPFYMGTLPQDGSRTQETHAGDDLGAEPGGIRISAQGFVLQKDQLPGDHHRAGTQRHQNVGAHTCGTVGIFPLRADYHTHSHGAKQAQTDILQPQFRGNTQGGQGGGSQYQHTIPPYTVVTVIICAARKLVNAKPQQNTVRRTPTKRDPK